MDNMQQCKYYYSRAESRRLLFGCDFISRSAILFSLPGGRVEGGGRLRDDGGVADNRLPRYRIPVVLYLLQSSGPGFRRGIYVFIPPPSRSTMMARAL